MDEFQNGYQPDENYNGPHIEEGDYKVKIANIASGTTRNGDPMLTIDLTIAEASIVFKHRIVKNQYFNANMTKFFDCFKIPRGNFEYNRWMGRVGKAHIAKGEPNDQGKAYWEISYLIVEQPMLQTTLPIIQQQAPQSSKAVPIFDDDIPF